MTEPSIRPSAPGDLAAIEALYPAAFPEEDLLPLARELLGDGESVLSLVAIRDGDLVGHVAFTDCRLPDAAEKPALLGPLAVAPAAQRQGVGSALVRDGLARLEASGATLVLVLGDPTYYRRFGFAVEAGVAPPYPLPEAWAGAWRSKRLGGPEARPRGALVTPAPWNVRAYWAP